MSALLSFAEVGVQTGEDPRSSAARKAKLQLRFDRLTDGEPHFLLIGAKIGAFGVEGASAAELSEPEWAGIVAATKAKSGEAGIEEEPKFLLQLAAQY